jgi:hypothetical protein
MTATAFLIASETGRILSTRPTEAKAADLAERIGARVVRRTIAVGERVTFTWHGWPKTGVVVDGKGARVSVSFPVKGATVTKSMSVEKLSFTR